MRIIVSKDPKDWKNFGVTDQLLRKKEPPRAEPEPVPAPGLFPPLWLFPHPLPKSIDKEMLRQ